MTKNCEMCHKESYHLYYTVAQGQMRCADCRDYVPSTVSSTTGRILPGGTHISSGHEWEIKHRQITPDGDVRINTGRKYV